MNLSAIPAADPGAADRPSPAVLIERARSLGSELRLQAAERDRLAAPPHDAFERIRQSRIGALRVPTRLGGAGGTHEDLAHAVIALARGDSSVAQALLPHFVFVERTLLMATPAHAAHYLGLIAQGKLVGGASAERKGRFRGEVHTLLRRQDGHYLLNGSKQYCTGALLGDLVKVLAVDEQGDSVLVVIPPERAGVHLHDDWEGMGQRCTASGSSEFVDVTVYPHEVTRVQRWQRERHHTGSSSQLIHCALDVGIALAALDDTVAWSRTGIRPVRESGLERAQEDPYILHTIGDIAAHAHAAQALVLQAARRIDEAALARYAPTPDAGGAETIERTAVAAAIATAQAKIVSTHAALHAGQLLFDVGGASSTLRGHNFDRHWRNARTHTTHDPVAYKLKAVGNYLLNDVPPPISYGY